MNIRLTEFFYPTACPFCGTLKERKIVGERGCCHACAEKYLHPAKRAVLPLPAFADSCIASVCGSYYGGPVRSAVRAFKFSEKNYLGAVFAGILHQILVESHLYSHIDLLVPVPISAERLRLRGYNQAALMAGALARRSGLEMEEPLIRRVQGAAQSSLLRSERITDAAGRFAAAPEAGRIVKGRAVLLIDDVLTTGSTIRETGRLLLEAGACYVIAACLSGRRREFCE